MDANTLRLLRPEDKAFHDEVVAWLGDHLPPFLARHRGSERDEMAQFQMLKDWQQEMVSGRWVAVDWPAEWGGRGATGVQKILLDLALVENKAPVSIWRQATDNIGPPLLRYGRREQQQAFLPGIVRGDSVWCQGFSEPNSGSDLASLSTRAEPCEGGYCINGQKIWTSNAYFSTHMWLLARTNRELPKHQGISAFVLDMKTSGITVQPIRELTGAKVGQQRYNQQFNQVFFDDVFIPEFNRIGPENEGWKVCKATLVVERASRYNLGLAAKSTKALHRLLSEPLLLAQGDRLASDYGDRVLELDMLIDGLEEIYQTNLQSVLSGRSVGGESSVLKLLSSEARQTAAELAFELAGPYAQFMAGSPDAIKGGNAAFELVRSRSCTIGGGTSEIQRNWIAQHLLGLPKN